ncbi:hypothetical protein ACRAWG_06995 [Methylobacterium sp. P31]
MALRQTRQGGERRRVGPGGGVLRELRHVEPPAGQQQPGQGDVGRDLAPRAGFEDLRIGHAASLMYRSR